MPCPEQIQKLVDRYRDNRADYESADYNETQARRELIDPLFKALGWDMDNEQGYAEAYKDVIHEDAIKIGAATKAPDYSFRIGGNRRFFLEAKKPAIDIKNDPSPAYQLRRYVWSDKLPLSLLTNFAELAVYDGRFKPQYTDKASKARVLYFTFEDYVEKWDEIAAIFSREAILKGSFDRFAESNKRKKGTAEVDTSFLAEIETWREVLAKNLALRNAELSTRDLNFAVQRIIDRIIFLRIAEDRGIEDYGRLLGLTNGDKVYARLREFFYAADDRYNSGIFHFRKEKDRQEAPDELTLGLEIDDKVLKEMIRRLYYPDSPYEFSVITVDILGQVYEQFLGKVISLTAGHRARVEEKPEVKKAGGVYYTPKYIVEYIVQQTVGKLLEEKSPKQVAKLRILDPACGSGSFLIGAYQYLLDWHLKWYVEHEPKKHTKAVHQDHRGNWRLTIAERKQILLNNIYGVDIDSQAVEVTKLSLLLKVLEGASRDVLERQKKFFHERALPDLGNNIKCGNSLIGSDFYRGRQLSLLDDEDHYRINVFDWDGINGFPAIMKSGGFDAVIGNPPYVRIQAMKEWAPLEVEFYKTAYASATAGNYDIYVVFVERGLSLINSTGKLGYILPHKFFSTEYGAPLRKLLSDGRHLDTIVHFGHNQVFRDATTYTCLLFLNKSKTRRCKYVQAKNLIEWIKTGAGEKGELLSEEIDGVAWNIHVGASARVMKRLARATCRLSDIAHLFVGLQTDADDVYILDEVGRKKGQIKCQSASTAEVHWFEADHLKPLLKGSLDVRRYTLSGALKHLVFPYHNSNSKSVLIPPDSYADRFPLTWNYLLANKGRLASRAKGKLGSSWYGYVYKKNHLRFDQPKIIAPAIATGACFAFDAEGKYYFVGSGGGGGGGYGIVLNSGIQASYFALLGILNSRLTTFFLKNTSTVFRGGYIALNRQYIADIPLPSLFLDQSANREEHDRIDSLARELMQQLARIATAKAPHENAMLERQIEAADRQIDAMVYELYGLTEDEIRIVEEATVR